VRKISYREGNAILSVFGMQGLLDRGIHPLRVAEGYELACKVATKKLDSIAHNFDFSRTNTEPLVQTCMTTLSSKMSGLRLSTRRGAI